MKKSKLEKGLTILVIIAICLISFVGIYVKKQGKMQNVLPQYRLGMNLGGARVTKYKVSDKTQEIVYDASGNVTSEGKNEDGSLKEGYTKEDKAINSEEVKNEENFKTAKRIIQNRLKNMGVSEYKVKLNHNSGEMIVEVPEDSSTDEVISNLTYLGKFEMKDSTTNEVLMNNQDVKQASCVYGNTATGTVVYLNIEFNKEGTKKFENITKTYISSTNEEGTTQTKNVSIELDGESMIKTYFNETISNGVLPLTIGSASTSSEEITSYIRQANQVAGLIDAGVMPVQYELVENNYMSPSIDTTIIKIIVGVIGIILVIGFINWIVRYKVNAVFSIISYLGFVAITLLAIRYANVVISLEAIVAVIFLLIASYMIFTYTLKQFAKKDANQFDVIKETYKRYASVFAPVLIMAVVFTFMNWLPISSIGMNLFWGITILVIYYYIVVRLLFDVQEVKK